MGSRGPVPKVTSRRTQARGMTTAVERLTRAPNMPADLSTAEQVIWRDLVPGIVRMGTVAAVDTPLLKDLVRALGRLDEAERDVDRRGLLIEGERGAVKNPVIQVARDYRASVLALSAKFGLSPIDRERLRLTLASAQQAQQKVDRPRSSSESLPANIEERRQALRVLG